MGIRDILGELTPSPRNAREQTRTVVGPPGNERPREADRECGTRVDVRGVPAGEGLLGSHGPLDANSAEPAPRKLDVRFVTRIINMRIRHTGFGFPPPRPDLCQRGHQLDEGTGTPSSEICLHAPMTNRWKVLLHVTTGDPTRVSRTPLGSDKIMTTPSKFTPPR